MDAAEEQIDYREIVAQAPVGIAQLDRMGRHVLANDLYCGILGRTRAEVLGKELREFIRHARLNGSPAAEEHSPVWKGIQLGISLHTTDEVIVRRDGTGVPVECWIRPITIDGEIQGAVCTLVQLAGGEKNEDLHNRELSHRVKNMFAIAQAVVGQTLRNISVPREIIHAINQRLAALSNANAVFMRTRSGNASIKNVVEAAVAAHRSDVRRVQVDGPDIELGSRAALAITLALHELSTNAAKYGALSGESGAVVISWTIVDEAAEKSFRMRWQEQDGPPVTPPTRKGFGSRLIVDNVGSDLRGRGELIFDSHGVRWTLEAPLAALTE